jgi:ATP-binding cassette subfamily F protein uup
VRCFMALINVRDVDFSFGGPLLLEGINFQISGGERVCLLGRNGCGKSSFLRVLAGEFEIDGGEIIRQPGLEAAMLTQSVPEGLEGKVFDVVAGGLGEAGRLLSSYHELSLEAGEDEKKLLDLHHRLDEVHAWGKLNVIETVLSQVGIDGEVEFGELSAGLKRRVLLARTLAAEPDVLMLDEPTNHLDIASINWLEEFLLGCGKTLLFVTHDRVFLKKLSTRIIEVDRGRLSSWNCNYEDYLKRKEQELSAEEGHWDQFDKKLAEEEQWIRRGIQGRRTRNEGRVRELMKLREARSARRNVDGRVKIEINAAQRSGDLVVETKGVEFGYGDGSEKVISGLTTTIMRGDRIGIIGPNGSGKTTLLRLLLGELGAIEGKIRLGSNVRCAYFDQLGGQLDMAKSLSENIGRGYDTITVNGRVKQVVAYLGDFLFTPHKARALASSLSGGERNRLQLAKVFTEPSNVLVLDEPTNDLDVETLELLEEMVMGYQGTVLIVSHDRAFLNNVVTSTLVLEGGGEVKEYAGGYDDWLRARGEVEAEKKVAVAKERRARPRNEGRVKLSYLQKKELAGLPDLIERLEGDIAELHERMGDTAFYRQDGEAIAEVNGRLAELEGELAEAYGRWEELAEFE